MTEDSRLKDYNSSMIVGTHGGYIHYLQNEKKLIDILAETWIIARFKDDGDFEQLTENKEHLFQIVFDGKKTSYTRSFKTLASICQILSLMSNDERDYHGDSFLLTRRPYDIFYSIERNEVFDVIEQFKDINFLLKYANRAKYWTYWLDGKDNILTSGKRLFTLYSAPAVRQHGAKIRSSQKQDPAQKLRHLGNHLKTANSQLSDPELMLIILVGTLEYLVTRNPDTNRFNIEDSINKQFRLKCAILIRTQHKDTPPDEVGKNLEQIYSLRSDFAHGNYVDNYDVDTTVKMVIILFSYLRQIINAYIDDRELVDFLKDS